MRGFTTVWRERLVTLVSVGILAVLLVGYVKRVDADAERRNIERERQICGIVRLLDARNQTMPPATDPATAEFRRELHMYRTNLGC